MKTMKILLLSTDYSDRDLIELTEALRSNLKQAGFTVTIHQRSSTDGALARLRSDMPFDLVLFDIVHPLPHLVYLAHMAQRYRARTVLGLEAPVQVGPKTTYPRCEEMRIRSVNSAQPIDSQLTSILLRLPATRPDRAVVPTSSLIKPKRLTQFDPPRFPSPPPPEPADIESMGRRGRHRRRTASGS